MELIEAARKEREKEREYSEKSQSHDVDCDDTYYEKRDYHKQIAGWLEELIEIKEKGEYIKGFNAGYEVGMQDAKDTR